MASPPRGAVVEPAGRPRTHAVRRGAATALSALVVAAMPVVLVGNVVWVLVQPWLVHAQYALPGLPEDRLGLSAGQRTGLAVVGVRAVRPLDDEGPAALRAARLPSGAVAFDAREVRHMDDVRGLIADLAIAWAVGVGVLVAAVVTLGRLGGPGAARRALARGGRTTLWLAGLLAVIMLVDFARFFAGFHDVLFEPESWRFGREDTLRSLYPDRFWGIAAGAAAALVVLQALAVARAAGPAGGRRRRAAGAS